VGSFTPRAPTWPVYSTRAPGHVFSYYTHPEDWTRSAFVEWGRLIGRVHEATGPVSDRESQRPAARLERVPALKHAAGMPEVAREHETLLEWLHSLPRTPDVFGLIHSEIIQGNMSIEGRRFTLFDFDDCLHHWHAHDLAMPLYYSSLFRPNWDRAALEKFLQALLEGYRDVHAIDGTWERRIWGFGATAAAGDAGLGRPEG